MPAATPAACTDAAAPPASNEPARHGAVWFAVAVPDMDLLRRRFPQHFGTVFAAWAVLIREAGFRRSTRFTLAESILADRAGLSRRTVSTIKAELKAAGLVTFSAPMDRKTRRQMPTRWHIRPAVFFGEKGEPCATVAHGKPCANDGGVSVAQTQSSLPPFRGKGMKERNEKTPPAPRGRHALTGAGPGAEENREGAETWRDIIYGKDAEQ